VNKSQLVDIISKKTAFTKTDSEKILDAALDTIQRAVAKGQDVKLVGFGTFSRFSRKQRGGRNPKTGKYVEIPATSVPKFKAGKEFKDCVK
jgi:DNA-binding protein HU-beta